MTSPPSPERPQRLLLLIAAFKLFKATLLFAAAYALHHLRHTDMGETLLVWARDVHIDPDSRYFNRLLAHATGVPPERLHHLGIGLFFYGLVFATEGTGLFLRQRWAEYFTVISTGLLLPLEAYELFHPGRRGVKGAVLVANLAIVAYLIWNLARTRRHDAAAVAVTPGTR